MKMNSLTEIAEELKKANSVLLFPHINLDGDAVGSCAALTRVLRAMGKECHTLIEDDIPQNLRFLTDGICTEDMDIIPEPDVTMSLDCSEYSRFPKREETFKRGKVRLCLDHHRVSEPVGDVNHIDSDAAATGELVYDLIALLGAEIDKETGEALFCAITTDTGNFQYSNATGRTHDIVSELYESGMDHRKVSIEVYESEPLYKVAVKNKAMSNLRIFADGRCATAHITAKEIAEAGATINDIEGVVSDVRGILGVELAAVLKETDEGEIKVSLRAKGDQDVSKIAEEFGGGGHKAAAGCTLKTSMEEALSTIAKAMEDAL